MIVRIERNPSGRQLSVFGVAWLVLFAIVGGTTWWETGSFRAAAALWAIGVAVPAIGRVWPGFLRIVFVLMSYGTFPIGFVVSYAILIVVYYLVLTPIGVVLRLRGHDPMQRRFDRDAKTYWTPREQEKDTGRYFRQF